MALESDRVIQELQLLADPAIAEHSGRFFKSGKGQYGEGDKFLGIRVPLLRKLAKQVNNWDLVDSSAPYIVGPELMGKDQRILFRLASSKLLWERRIAVLATFHFIRQGDYHTILQLTERLLDDREDLMHKACGWMLREVANRDVAVARAFLDRHATRMPRTMLRYAIEKFPEKLRQQYLKSR